MNRTPQYLGEKLKREVKIHYVPERIKNPLGYNCRVNEIVKKGNYDILWCNFCTLSDITWLKAAKNMEFRLGLHTAIILKTWGTN